MTIPHLTPNDWYDLWTGLDALLGELVNGDLGYDEGDDVLAAQYEALLEKIGNQGSNMTAPAPTPLPPVPMLTAAEWQILAASLHNQLVALREGELGDDDHRSYEAACVQLQQKLGPNGETMTPAAQTP